MTGLRAARCQVRTACEAVLDAAGIGSARRDEVTRKVRLLGKRVTHRIKLSWIIVRHARRSLRKCEGENAS